MARPGITYQEVSAACDQLIATNETPTIQKVREVLGTGSPNTILRHLNAWRDAAPVVERKAAALPPELQAAIINEIARQSAESRAEIEKNLIQFQAEASELSIAGELLENEADRLNEDNKNLSDESQKYSALANERKQEIDKLGSDLKAERDASEDARLKLAQELNRTELLNSKANDLTIELTALKSSLKESEALRTQAERDLAVLAAKHQAEQYNVKRLEVDLKNKGSELISERKAAALTLKNTEEALNKIINDKATEQENKITELLASTKDRENDLSNQVQSLSTDLLASQTNAAIMEGRLSEIDKQTKPVK